MKKIISITFLYIKLRILHFITFIICTTLPDLPHWLRDSKLLEKKYWDFLYSANKTHGKLLSIKNIKI